MNVAPPKFRSDLKAVRHQNAEGVSFIIKDPATDQFFRFREVEHYISLQCDGETPPDIIRDRVAGKFGGDLPSEMLASFVRTLDDAGLLDNENSSLRRKSKKESGSRLQGTLLYVRYRIINPERILDWLIHRVRFFFSPVFVGVAGGLIALAVLLTWENWPVFTADLPRLWRVEVIPLFLVLGFLVISAHEFAHGLTCRHYGGRVREMGFMLMYFQPALYCNVSDAWLFPERSKRLWVGFAGMFFELFLWAIAVMVWRVTDTDTLFNLAALLTMAGSGISTLANLNPLIKLDGYYMLSDFLNIPNMRKKAFRYVGDLAKSVIGIAEPPGEGYSLRERRIFLAYGLLGVIGSLSIMSIMTFEVGAYLIQNSQPLVLSLFLALVGTRFRKRLRRVFSSGSLSFGDDEDGPGTESRKSRIQHTTVNPEGGPRGRASMQEQPMARHPAVIPKGGLPVPVTKEKRSRSSRSSSRRSRRKRKKLINPYILAFAGLLILEILFFGWMELRIGGPFNILPVHYVDVRAEVEGVIEEVAVTEGMRVNAGDVVARISDRELRAGLDQANASITKARADLRMLEQGPTTAEMELARAAISKARDNVKFVKARVDRNKLLLDRGIISPMEYETSMQELNSAENEVIEAEKQYTVIERKVRPEQIRGAEAQLAGFVALRETFVANLERVAVKTPVAGVVVTPKRQLSELHYQRAQKGTVIARIGKSNRLTVDIAISEKDIGDVKIGHTVAFKARAFPDSTFYGVVVATAQVAGGVTNPDPAAAPQAPSGAPTTVLVTTEIDNSSGILKPGLTGYAKIYCGERRIISLLLRRLAQTIKVEFWSWW